VTIMIVALRFVAFAAHYLPGFTQAEEEVKPTEESIYARTE